MSWRQTVTLSFLYLKMAILSRKLVLNIVLITCWILISLSIQRRFFYICIYVRFYAGIHDEIGRRDSFDHFLIQQCTMTLVLPNNYAIMFIKPPQILPKYSALFFKDSILRTGKILNFPQSSQSSIHSTEIERFVRKYRRPKPTLYFTGMNR